MPFVVERDQVFVWHDIDGILAMKVGYPSRYWFECINAKEEPFSADGSVAYIEAQVLGGIHIDESIELLYYPETDRYDKEFFGKLQRLARKFLNKQRTEGEVVPSLRRRLIPY